MTGDVRRSPEARRHLRRILAGFVFVVVFLPLVALGGRWTLVLLPLLAAAAVTLREAVALRRLIA